MKGNVEVANPNDAILRIVVEAPVSEWKALLKDMPDAWPKWQFSSLVRDSIEKTVGRLERLHEVNG